MGLGSHPLAVTDGPWKPLEGAWKPLGGPARPTEAKRKAACGRCRETLQASPGARGRSWITIGNSCRRRQSKCKHALGEGLDNPEQVLEGLWESWEGHGAALEALGRSWKAPGRTRKTLDGGRAPVEFSRKALGPPLGGFDGIPCVDDVLSVWPVTGNGREGASPSRRKPQDKSGNACFKEMRIGIWGHLVLLSPPEAGAVPPLIRTDSGIALAPHRRYTGTKIVLHWYYSGTTLLLCTGNVPVCTGRARGAH